MRNSLRQSVVPHFRGSLRNPQTINASKVSFIEACILRRPLFPFRQLATTATPPTPTSERPEGGKSQETSRSRTSGRESHRASSGWIVGGSLAAAIVGGYAYYYSKTNDVTAQEMFRTFMAAVEEAGHRAQEGFERGVLDKFTSNHSEPLLVEKKMLDLPDFVPTLVIDFDKTIALMEHDHTKGWRCLKRPYADQFLQELSRYYELVIWSDDAAPTAQDVMYKWGIPVSGVLHRDFCLKKRYGYVKDLSRLGRDPDKMIMLDHSEAAFAYQKENGLLVREYTGAPDDRELLYLLDYLKAAGGEAHDVRAFLDTWGHDVDAGKRFMMYKEDRDKNVESRRSLGRALLGGTATTLPGDFPHKPEKNPKLAF